MKKFTILASALMLSGLGFGAMAQDLGQAIAVVPDSEYTDMGYMGQFVFGSVDTPETIYFVNPQDGHYDWDEDGDFDYQYANIQVTLPTGNTYNVQAQISTQRGGRAVETAEGNVLGYDMSMDDDLMQELGYAFPAGQYTVYIPENTVKNAEGATNAATTITYKYYEFSWNYPTVNPAEGLYTEAELSTVEVNYGASVELFPNIDEESSYVLIYNTADYSNPVAKLSGSQVTKTANGFSINMSSYIKNGNEYQIIVPDKFAIVDDPDSGLSFSLGTQPIYKVWDGLDDASYTGVENYTTYYEFPVVTFTWGEGIAPTPAGLSGWLYYNLYDITQYDPNSDVRYAIPSEAFSVNGNYMTLNIGEYLTDLKPGAYIIQLNSGIVQDGTGKTNPSQTLPSAYFNLAELCDVEPEVIGDGDGRIMVTWDLELDQMSWGMNYDEAYILSSNGTKYPLAAARFGQPGEITIDENSATVTIDVINLGLTDGETYTLVMPRGVVLLTYNNWDNYDAANEAINYTFVYPSCLPAETPDTPTPENYSVTFNFVDGAEDFIKVLNPAEDDADVEITGDSYVFEYTGTAGLVFAVDEENYDITIECTNFEGTEAPYTVEYYGTDGLMPQATVTVTPAADGLIFNVTVTEVEVPANESAVTISFTGVANAQNYVVVRDMVNEEVIDVPSNSFTYAFTELGGILFTANEGYTLEVSCTNYTGSEENAPFSITGINPLVEDDEPGITSVMLSLIGEADGLKFEVKVSEDTTTGINGIGADANGNYSVFGINGVNVMNTNNASDLNGLNSGLYIINGKKVIIRK